MLLRVSLAHFEEGLADVIFVETPQPWICRKDFSKLSHMLLYVFLKLNESLPTDLHEINSSIQTESVY